MTNAIEAEFLLNGVEMEIAVDLSSGAITQVELEEDNDEDDEDKDENDY